MGLMGIFSKKVDPNNIFNKITGMVDDTRLTEEEAAKFNMLKAEKVLEFASKTADENSTRSKARRGIAYVIIGNAFIAFWAGIILRACESKQLQEAGEYIKQISNDYNMAQLLMAVVAFYFGGYYLNKMNPWSKENKESKK
jgi:hypothetical protein